MGLDRGHVPFHDPAFEVPPDGSPVRIRLEKGRDALVILEDERGRKPDASVWAELPTGAEVASRKTKRGHYLLEGLPDGPVTIVFHMNRREPADWIHHRRELGAHEIEHRIVLPVGGRVEARVTMPPGVDPEALCYVSLVPEEEARDARSLPMYTNAPVTSELAFEDVLPGRYRVVVRHRDLERIPDVVYEELGGSIRVEVESERTARVDLRP